MDAAQAKKIVIVGTVGTGVLTAVATVRRQREAPLIRVAAGVLVSGVLLAGLAEFLPGLAAGLAALMVTTAAFVLGGDAWEGVSAITAIDR